MSLKDPLPRYVLWITRIIGYTVGAIAISIAWYIFGNMRLVTHYVACLDKPRARDGVKLTAMENAKALVACVDARSGIVEWLAFRPMKKLFSDLPSSPSNYVGIWLSRRGDTLYQITLDGNGQFFAKPASGRDAGCVTGSWGVIGSGDIQKVVWLYDQGQFWPPDINPIEKTTPDGFVLVEKNGSRTEFTRTEHSMYGDNYCASMQSGKSFLPKSETAPVKQVEGNNEYAQQTDVYAERGTNYGQPSKFAKTGYVATTEDGKELLWRDYVDEGDMYCVPIQGGRICFLKNKIASIREVSGIRSKDFDQWFPSAVIPKGWADKRRSPAEESLDDYEEEYPERTESMAEPPHNDFSLIGAGKLCRYAVLNMSDVQTAERTNILPYKDKFGRYGHRFCFKTRSSVPGQKVGLLRSILCSIYRVGDEWQYELKSDCDFMQ